MSISSLKFSLMYINDLDNFKNYFFGKNKNTKHIVFIVTKSIVEIIK